jgi:hypothetical protein
MMPGVTSFEKEVSDTCGLGLRVITAFVERLWYLHTGVHYPGTAHLGSLPCIYN